MKTKLSEDYGTHTKWHDPESQETTWANRLKSALTERDNYKAQRDELLVALKVIKAEMEALKRDEPRASKRMDRLGARFDWKLTVYDPIANCEQP